jgi:RNA polymerase sigma-70 factor (ECF subfamily)
MPNRSDAVLVDDDRFERVWRSYGATLLRYCRFVCGSYEAAEDAAAETMTAFLRKGEKVADEHVEAWLLTVARNFCRGEHRRSTRWGLLAPMVVQPAGAEADGQPGSDVAWILGQLAPDARLAVYLRVVEQRPFSEVARVVGRSEDATKKMVYRALARLRDRVQRSTATSLQRGDDDHD